jgi:uncharacterized protein YndB with AHSA1/START domain
MTEPERVIDLSVDVPGNPEQVWDAIATGPGITSWFIPHEVEERQGGTVRKDFGPGIGQVTGTVTSWEPPSRVVFDGEGDGALAHEWLVEARDGSSCVVRLVVSGFGSGADWDAQYDGLSSGWQIFLHNLRLYLTHFAGQHGRAIIPTKVTAGPKEAAFARLCAAVGLPADLREGDRLQAAGPGVPALSGTVEDVVVTDSAHTYFLVIEDPAPGTAFLAAEGTDDAVMISFYLYLFGEAGAAVKDEWTALLAERFPPPEFTSS